MVRQDTTPPLIRRGGAGLGQRQPRVASDRPRLRLAVRVVVGTLFRKLLVYPPFLLNGKGDEEGEFGIKLEGCNWCRGERIAVGGRRDLDGGIGFAADLHTSCQSSPRTLTLET